MQKLITQIKKAFSTRYKRVCLFLLPLFFICCIFSSQVWSTDIPFLKYENNETNDDPVLYYGNYSKKCSTAELIALESAETLLAPQSLIVTIREDLALIRMQYPQFRSFSHHTLYSVGEITVRLDSISLEDFKSGKYRGFDELNKFYGPVEITIIAKDTVELVFEKCYNPIMLAEIYKKVTGVVDARPSFEPGSRRLDYIAIRKSGIYDFVNRFGDCPAGCLAWRSWTFFVINNKAKLIAEEEGPKMEYWGH